MVREKAGCRQLPDFLTLGGGKNQDTGVKFFYYTSLTRFPGVFLSSEVGFEGGHLLVVCSCQPDPRQNYQINKNAFFDLLVLADFDDDGVKFLPGFCCIDVICT